MDKKLGILFTVFLIGVLLSGTALSETYHTSSSCLHEVNETNDWSRAAYNVPYSDWLESPNRTIFLLSKLNEESLTNCTNPKSQIYDSNVLKAYGKVPAIKNTVQFTEFSSKLETLRNNSIPEIKPDLYPDGPIVDYGSGQMPGYFLIKLYNYEGQKTVYSEAELKKIYSIIEKNAIKAGIEEVPVIFSLWDKTAIFYFPKGNSTLNPTLGGDVIQITNIEFPVLYYNISNYSSTASEDVIQLKDIEFPLFSYSIVNSSSLQIIKNNSVNEIKPYLYPKGPIVEFGSDVMEGVFSIKLYSEGNGTVYSQPELDKIHSIVRKNANKVGLENISVIFYNSEGIIRFDGNNDIKIEEFNNSSYNLCFWRNLNLWRNLNFKPND